MDECVTYSSSSFPTLLVHTYRDLVLEGNFADVTLVTDDQIQIPAHKIVLSGSSSVFKSIFLNNPHTHPLLYLRGVKQEELQSILQFIYLGQTKVDKDRVKEFFNTAKDFEIKGLETNSVNEVNSNKAVETVNLTELKPIGNKTGIANGEEKDSYVEIEEVMEEVIINENEKSYLEPLDEIKTECIENDEIDREDFIESECDSTFVSSPVKEVEEIAQYSCNQCTKVGTVTAYTNIKSLSYHEKNVHKGVKYSCNECGLQFTRTGGLRDHQKSKHEGFSYFCDQCEFRTTNRTSLRPHKQAAHGDTKYFCDQCEYNTTVKKRLSEHKLSLHEGKKYLCDQCDYKTAYKKHLKSHQQFKHEGLKYSCNHCEYEASSQNIIEKHEKSIHDGVIYVCDQCEYKTGWEASLGQHKKTKHTLFN